MQYDIAATFVTTFLGVLLAFGLENGRQRRRTTEWVRQHLGHLRVSLVEEVATGKQVDAVIAAQVGACNAWIAARSGDDVLEEQWELIFASALANAPDFGAVLRSEAVTSLPPALALALSQVEYAGRGVESGSSAAEAARTAVAPLWFDRTVPLSPSDRRRVEVLRDTITQLAERVKAIRGPLDDLVSAIDDWVPPRRTRADHKAR
jgi:hypothetical protein